MKISDDQLQNLIKQSNAEPTNEWQQSTLENLKNFSRNSVTDFSAKSNINSNLIFILFFMLKRKVAVLSALAVAVLAVVLTTAFVLTRLSTQSSNNSFDQKSILQKIAMNNPNLGQYSVGSSAENAAALATRDMASSKMIAPAPGYMYQPASSYYYSKSTTERGPAFNSCTYGVDQTNVVFVPVYESFNYNGDSNYYSKYVGYNEDGTVNTYNLSKSTSTSTTYRYENIAYYGGSYAVRTVSETQVDPAPVQIDPMPVDLVEPSLPERPVEAPAEGVGAAPEVDYTTYFGPEAQVLRTENINGREYYVIQYSYDVNCAGFVNLNRWQSEDVEDLRKMFYLSYADTETYQILRTETYLDSVSVNNLVERSETIVENADLDFASVSGNFDFEYNVEVKDIDLNTTPTDIPEYNPDAEIQKALDFARNENITVVVPSAVVENQYIYFNSYINDQPVVDSTTSYYTDRSFYPSGVNGDKMYNSYAGVGTYLAGNTPMSLGMTSYSRNSVSYNLSFYSNEYSNLDILNSLLWNKISDKKEEIVAININGESVNAALYSFVSESSSIMPLAMERSALLPVDSANCENNECRTKNYILVFGYGNNKFTLQEYNYSVGFADSEFTADDAMFLSLSAQNSEDYVELQRLVNNSVKGTYGSGSSSSEPKPAI